MQQIDGRLLQTRGTRPSNRLQVRWQIVFIENNSPIPLQSEVVSCLHRLSSLARLGYSKNPETATSFAETGDPPAPLRGRIPFCRIKSLSRRTLCPGLMSNSQGGRSGRRHIDSTIV